MQAFFVVFLALIAGAYAAETVVHSATCYLQRVDNVYATGGGLVTFTEVGGIISSWDISGLSPGRHWMGIYQYGDLLSVNGTTLGPLNELNSGSPFNQFLTVGSNGTSSGVLGIDNNLALNGFGDIIGRSVAVLGDSTDSTKLVMSCVIGRNDGPLQELETELTGDRNPVIRRATCQFRNTSYVTPAGFLAGWVDFEQLTPTSPVTIEYFVHNVIRQDVVYHTSHVHWTGDISTPAATGVGGHYNNTYYVTVQGHRPPPSLDEVGDIGNTYNFTSDYKDTLTASFTDNIVSLSGRNSIIGRSVVIHGWAGGASTRIAQCVIGIKSDGEGAAPVPAISTAGGGPAVDALNLNVNQTTRASCLLKPTVAGTAISNKLTGMVHFETQPTGYVRVRYHMAGLTPGYHSWHVHMWGDLGMLPDGQNTGDDVSGHFVGIVTDRTPDTLQEVGALDNSKPIWADPHGFSRGEFIDDQIRLNGPNAIVGRSIIVHGDSASTATRIAECAIGKRLETAVYDADIGPVGQPVNFAVAHVVYTSLAGNTVLLGRVTFTQPSPDSDVAVHFDFSGLVPNALHPWHVHQFGDLLAWDTVSSVSGHFVGQNPVRPAGKKQEVGLLNDGTPLTADATGASTGDFVDTQIKLSGINSIVGRAVVVHIPTTINGFTVSDGVARQAWGVIGIAPYNAASALQPTWVLLVLIVCAIARMW